MSDVYKIGVAIALSSNGLPILGALAAGLLNIDKAAAAATGKMNALKVAALGAMGVVAGVGTLRAMGQLVEHGAELVHQQNLLRRAGVDNQRVAEATARAWDVTRQVQGTRVADNLRMFGELRSQVSSEDQALALLPDVARMGMLMQNETGRQPGAMAQTIMRVLEQRGQVFGADGHTMDLDKVRAEMGMMYQAMSASHGLITPQTFLGFMQQAGPAGMALTPQAFYGMMPTAMQTMGGNRAGTAMASLFAQFVGGVTTQRTATELQHLGLLDPEKLHVRRGGQVTLDPGAIRGFDPTNPFSYFAGENSPFQSAVRAHGGNAGQALEGVLDPRMVQELYRSLGRETTRRLVAEFIQLAPTFERDFKLRQQTMTPEAAQQEASHDPKLAMTSFTAAWNNLQTALGAPLVNTAVEMLGKLTGALNGMTAWAVAHPGLIEKVGQAVGILAIGLTAIGATAVVATLVALGGTVGLLAALATGIIALGVAFKDDIAGGIKAAADKVRSGLDAIRDAVMGWITGLGGLAGEVTAALGRITAAIRDWITGLPGRIPNGGPAQPNQPNPFLFPGSYRPSAVPHPANSNVTLINYTVLDGQVIARNVTNRLTRAGSGPSNGTTGFDPRAGFVGSMQAA